MPAFQLDVGPGTGISWPGHLKDHPVDAYFIWADLTAIRNRRHARSRYPFLIRSKASAPHPFYSREMSAKGVERAMRNGDRACFLSTKVPSVGGYGPYLPSAGLSAAGSNEVAPLCVGVIDDKFPVLSSRYGANPIRLWDQGQPGAGPQASGFGYGYGRHFDLPVAGRPAESAPNYQSMGLWSPLRAGISHGAHVLDVLVGDRPLFGSPPLRQGPRGAALTAPLVLVQLPQKTVADVSGGSLRNFALDAVSYIIKASRSMGAEKTVICMPYGTLAGPHNGTSLFEQALDHMLAGSPGVSLVLPAGNGHLSETHAIAEIQPQKSVSLCMRVPPDNARDSYVELWLPLDAEARVECRSPSGDHLSVTPGSAQFASDPARVGCSLIYPRQAANAEGLTMVLLAISATSPASPAYGGAPHGDWTLSVSNLGKTPLAFDAWIQRSGQPFGFPQGARQSRWIDRPGCLAPEPLNTISAMATGSQPRLATASYAASRYQSGALCPYSPAVGPTATRRPAPYHAEESPALPGLLARGTLGRRIYRMNGTSVAAALMARDLATHPIPSIMPAPPPGKPPSRKPRGQSKRFADLSARR